MVTFLHPRSSSATRMTSNDSSSLALLSVYRQSKVRQRLELEINGVGVDDLASRNRNRFLALELEALERLGVNLSNTGFSVYGKGN